MDLVEESVPLRGTALQVLRPRNAEALLDEHAFEHEEYLPDWAQRGERRRARPLRRRARAAGARVLELGAASGCPASPPRSPGVASSPRTGRGGDRAARADAARNGAAIETALVDWASPQAIVERAPWDLVLAADVLYERRNVAAAARAAAPPARLARRMWLADPGRAPADVLLEGLGEGWTRRAEADGRVTLHRLMRAAVPSESE